MPQEYTNDHDLLIQLGSKADRQEEVLRTLLSEVSRLNQKLDNMSEVTRDQTRDIREIRTRQRDDDLRIATLESQVDTLRDVAENHEAAAEGRREEAKRWAQKWAALAVVVSPILAIVIPILWRAFIALVAGSP